MPINLDHEKLLTLAEAAEALPRLRGDRKIHVSTLYRWISRGVRGIKLEAVRLGRTLVTSQEALQRFAERLARPQAQPKAIRVEAASDRAEAELDRHGL